jgi:hypothetical protein
MMGTLACGDRMDSSTYLALSLCELHDYRYLIGAARSPRNQGGLTTVRRAAVGTNSQMRARCGMTKALCIMFRTRKGIHPRSRADRCSGRIAMSGPQDNRLGHPRKAGPREPAAEDGGCQGCERYSILRRRAVAFECRYTFKTAGYQQYAGMP